MDKTWARVRWFEAGVALLGAAAFVVVGPLRDVFAALPEVLPAATLVLFMAPGALPARWFLGEHFSGAALVPTAFVIGAGAFALLGVPMLIAQVSLGVYLWASGTLVAVSLLAAAATALLSVLRQEWAHRRRAEAPASVSSGGLMWVPFVVLTGVLVYVCRINAPSFYGDIWIYLSWMREFLGGDALASEEPYFGDEVGLSRARVNGWLLMQAAFSRVSGVEPVDLVFSYINPVLAVVALLAFYALARVLFESGKAALFCGCLYALFFLVHLDASRLSFGGEFVQRLAEDKLATKFLFLPMALAFAVAFLKGGGRAYFWGFAFVCCAVMAVHPIGLAVIGVSMAGFAVPHLASNPRSRVAWVRIPAMGLAGLTVIAVPAILVLAFTGEPLTAVLTDSDINSNDPDVLYNMIFVQPGRHRIFELADGSYIMHPSLILDPVIAVAFLLGFPFLLWRVLRRRSVAAQLLLGTMCLTTILVYVPPITTFLGDNVVLPGQIWRLAWPIPLAALLALGWLVWEAMSRVQAWLLGFRTARPFARNLAGTLPLLVVLTLSVVAVPQVRTGIELVKHQAEDARSAGVYPADPIYAWLREAAASPEVTSPVVVLAPEVESARIPAYSSEMNVISRRGGLVLQVLPKLERRVPGQIEVPRGARDVRKFFSRTTLEEGVRILRRHQADYLMVRASSPLDRTIDRLSGFAPMQESSKRYDVYEVDLRKLKQLVGT